jgi:RNA-directed DNA polymerase
MGKTIMQMKARTQEEVIDKINPMLRGFANYYRGVVSKETFSYIESGINGWHSTMKSVTVEFGATVARWLTVF